MGLFRDNETVIQIEHNKFKNPNWQQANQLAFYSVAEDLNSAKTSKNQSLQSSQCSNRFAMLYPQRGTKTCFGLFYLNKRE